MTFRKKDVYFLSRHPSKFKIERLYSVLIKIQDITLGQYAPGDSVIHCLDPRTKVLSTLFFMSLLLITHRLEILLLFFVLGFVFFIVSGLNPKLGLKNLRPFLWLFLLTFILNAMFTRGKILWKIPFLNVYITEEGIFQGVFYTLRIAILVVLANLLTLTTSPMSLTDGIERFLSPFKRIGIRSHEIAMMLSISLRFIPILIEEADRIRKAQISRGGSFEGNILKKIKSIVSLIVPLFLSTFRRANDLALAMDARCYRGGVGRTSYNILRFTWTDGAVLFGIFLICLPVILIR